MHGCKSAKNLKWVRVWNTQKGYPSLKVMIKFLGDQNSQAGSITCTVYAVILYHHIWHQKNLTWRAW